MIVFPSLFVPPLKQLRCRLLLCPHGLIAASRLAARMYCPAVWRTSLNYEYKPPRLQPEGCSRAPQLAQAKGFAGPIGPPLKRRRTTPHARIRASREHKVPRSAESLPRKRLPISAWNRRTTPALSTIWRLLNPSPDGQATVREFSWFSGADATGPRLPRTAAHDESVTNQNVLRQASGTVGERKKYEKKRL